MISVSLSVLSLTLSLLVAYVTYRNRKRDVPFDVVPKAYERYYDMNKIELQYPHLTHLFVTYDKYESVKSIVCAAVANAEQEKLESYLLQERAVVDLILSYYEQIKYQWKYTRDSEREFVKGIIEYFEGRLLRNPRLVWWWQDECGGLETSYEKYTRDEWRTRVFEPIDKSAPGWQDKFGPFRTSRTTN